MSRSSSVRRMLLLVAAVVFSALGVVANAAPAAATGTTIIEPFDLGEVTGVVRFSGDGHSYRVEGTVRNDRSAGSVGYRADALSPLDNGQAICVTGPPRTNAAPGTVRSWDDVAACASPYLHAVRIHTFVDGAPVGQIDILNPWAN